MAVAVAIANTGLDHRASRQECCGAFASAAMPAQMFKCRLNVETSHANFALAYWRPHFNYRAVDVVRCAAHLADVHATAAFRLATISVCYHQRELRSPRK